MEKTIFVDKIFLYGTLKSGGPFYKLFEHYVLKNQPAYTYGTLYLKNNLPYFVEKGDHKVYGELITIFNVNEVLDFLSSHYIDKVPKILEVYSVDSDKPYKAYSFVGEEINNDLELIETGFWDNTKVNFEEII
ncbi:MAG: gamma-glutamylcyclotransferase [Deferribacterales bacterium]